MFSVKSDIAMKGMLSKLVWTQGLRYHSNSRGRHKAGESCGDFKGPALNGAPVEHTVIMTAASITQI